MNRFQTLVTVATRHPRLALLGVAAVTLLSIGLIVLGPLDVSTSRRDLVSLKSPYQARLFDFYDRFGRPDTVIFTVTGGKAAERQKFVEHLLPRLERIDALEGRVLGKLGPAAFAEVLFVQRPELLGRLASARQRADDPDGGGFVAAVDAIKDRIYDGLEAGDDDRPADGQSFERLASLAEAFDKALKDDGGLDLSALTTEPLSGDARLDDKGYFVADEGEIHLVMLFPELTSDEGSELAPLIDGIRSARDAALAETGAVVGADVTGLPALAVDELRIVRSGIRLTSALSATGILILLYFAFRSVRHTVVVLVPLLLGVLITLGFVELVYDGLNLITSSFTSVLMGLGIDFGVHLLHRYGEGQRRGHDSGLSMIGALTRAGPGVTTGAVTTIIAFVATTTTEFGAFAQLGVITAVGLGIMMACAFLVIPALMRPFAAERQVAPPSLVGLGRVMELVADRPKTILILAAVAIVASIVSLLPRGPGYNGRYLEFLPRATESYRALKLLEAKTGLGPATANFAVDSVESARKLTHRLRALPEVGRVQTPSDLLPPLTEKRKKALARAVAELDGDEILAEKEKVSAKRLAEALVDLRDAVDEAAFALEQAGRPTDAARKASRKIAGLETTLRKLPAGDDRLGAISTEIRSILDRAVKTARRVASRGAYTPDDLPPLFHRRFVSSSGNELAVYAYPAGDVWEESFSERFTEVVHAVDPRASGLALNVLPHERYITEGFQRAALYAVVLIALFLLLVFRNVAHAALAMLPVVVAWIWMLGAMKPLGLVFTPANIVALPLLLGIGLDAGAHMVHRYRESRAAGRQRARLDELVGGTGAAVIVASLTTMAGFAALMAADYGGMKSLGLLLTVGIGLSLLSSLFVLPALLKVFGRLE